jgi:hypothetical protein
MKFVVEIAAFAAFAYWGATIGSGVASLALAVALPAFAIVLWGVFAAPRSERRLATRARIPFELSVFGLAIVALSVSGAVFAAVVLAVLVAASTMMLTSFDQWDA